MQDIQKWFLYEFTLFGLNLVVKRVLIALLVLVSVFVALKIVKKFVLVRLNRWSNKTDTKLDDVLVDLLESLNGPFFALSGLYISLRYLGLSKFWLNLVLAMLILALTISLANNTRRFLIHYFKEKKAKKAEQDYNQKFDESMIQLFGILLAVALWIVGILSIFGLFGINIDTLLGTLGIGGIAVAFAMQNVLADIFASFSIYFDRPFSIGDFIIVGQDKGTVENIGIKSTRIKSLEGEELVLSNKELTEARIRNYKRMERRRVLFTIGVDYSTSNEKLKLIPDLIRNIFKDLSICTLDRVHFKSFNVYSLDFEIVYFIDSPEYIVYMDIQQKVNLEIKQAFEREGIKFAFPTQVLFLEQNPQIEKINTDRISSLII